MHAPPRRFPSLRLCAIAAAGLALAGATAASPASAATSQSVSAANAAGETFGIGKWSGSGAYSHSESSPMSATFYSTLRFTLSVDENGSVHGKYREYVTGTGHRGRFRARLKGLSVGRIRGSAAAPVMVGDLQLGGTFTLGRMSSQIRLVREIRRLLRIRGAGCMQVAGPNWRATRVGTPPKPRSAAWFEEREASLIRHLDGALDMTYDESAATQLLSLLPQLKEFNVALNQARSCHRAPAGYGRGLAGRQEIVTRLAALIKRVTTGTSRFDPATFSTSDIVDLVHIAVDAGLVGPGATNADSGVKSGLETLLNDALSTVLGRPAYAGVVEQIKGAAQRAGMSSVLGRLD